MNGLIRDRNGLCIRRAGARGGGEAGGNWPPGTWATATACFLCFRNCLLEAYHKEGAGLLLTGLGRFWLWENEHPGMAGEPFPPGTLGLLKLYYIHSAFLHEQYIRIMAFLMGCINASLQEPAIYNIKYWDCLPHSHSFLCFSITRHSEENLQGRDP